ncbi:toluene tolerance protein Ttg2D [Leptospira perolatii]|uniref:Toluene tolerance protein Ttg2D n=1 Tax=Leptospira perolatii TaxID=2023191 RepID=A0A2M9ZQ00_9LEPT|nr:ABC transporter substrate-binding protein [Leptospira perolatii]PJZ68985.1 toluene tolerance protein Ttg2D [Leptospira perolatii]PJZ74146.1 toluene tolerance protein Ttg2D [Leptospira perolatii]
MKKIISSLMVAALFLGAGLYSQEQSPSEQTPQTTNEESQNQASSPEDKALATVKKLIGFIRYKKNEKALALIHTGIYASKLVGKTTFSEQEKKDFEEAVKEYIVHKGFPVAAKYFDKIDITYENPVIKNNEIRIGSSILYKGSDKVVFAWILNEVDGNWVVTDFETEGKLSTETNRVKSIEPAIKAHGVKGTIALIRKMAKS